MIHMLNIVCGSVVNSWMQVLNWIFFNKLYKLINFIFTCLFDNLILCQHLFIQIFADSNPFHKDKVNNIQERCRNMITELIEASADSS